MDRSAQQPPPEHLMLERIARLETAQSYERATTTREFLQLDRRLCRLEARHDQASSTPPPIGAAGWFKITLAILIPLTVLAATGSPQQAAQVSLRMMGVSP